jgi:hypothetical protein
MNAIYHKRLENTKTYPTSNELINLHLHLIHCARKLKPELFVKKPLRMPYTPPRVMAEDLIKLELNEYYKRRAEDYCYMVTKNDDKALKMMEMFQ